MQCEHNNRWENLDQLSELEDEFNAFIDHTFVCEYHEKILEDYGSNVLPIVNDALTVSRELEIAVPAEPSIGLMDKIYDFLRNNNSAKKIRTLIQFLLSGKLVFGIIALTMIVLLGYIPFTISKLMIVQPLAVNPVGEEKPPPISTESKAEISSLEKLIAQLRTDSASSGNSESVKKIDLIKNDSSRVTLEVSDKIAVINVYNLDNVKKNRNNDSLPKPVSKTVLFTYPETEILVAMNVNQKELSQKINNDVDYVSSKPRLITKNNTYFIPAKFGMDTKNEELNSLIGSLFVKSTEPDKQEESKDLSENNKIGSEHTINVTVTGILSEPKVQCKLESVYDETIQEILPIDKNGKCVFQTVRYPTYKITLINESENLKNSYFYSPKEDIKEKVNLTLKLKKERKKIAKE